MRTEVDLKQLASSPIVDKFIKERLEGHENVVFTQDEWKADKGATFIVKANGIKPLGKAPNGSMTFSRLYVDGFNETVWRKLRDEKVIGAAALTFVSVGTHVCVIVGISAELKLSSMYAYAKQGSIPSSMRLMSRLAPQLFIGKGSALPKKIDKPQRVQDARKIQAEFVGDGNYEKPKSSSFELGEQSRKPEVLALFPTENSYMKVTKTGLVQKQSRNPRLQLTRDNKAIAIGIDEQGTSIVPLRIDMFMPTTWAEVQKNDGVSGAVGIITRTGNALITGIGLLKAGKIQVIYLKSRYRIDEQIVDIARENPALFGQKPVKVDVVKDLLKSNSPLFEYDAEKAVAALDSAKDLTEAKKKKLLIGILDGLRSNRVRDPITRLADLVLNDILGYTWANLDVDEIQKHLSTDLIHRQEDDGMFKTALQDLNELDSQSGYERGYIFYLILYNAYSEASDYSKYVPKPMRTAKVLKMAKELGMLNASDVKTLKN